jgi:hypothetical protein
MDNTEPIQSWKTLLQGVNDPPQSCNDNGGLAELVCFIDTYTDANRAISCKAQASSSTKHNFGPLLDTGHHY